MRTENPNDCRINSAGAEKRICPGGVYGMRGKTFHLVLPRREEYRKSGDYTPSVMACAMTAQ